MKDFLYYCSLPDSMSGGELYIEFLEIVESGADTKCNKSDVVNILLELSERQWNTCMILSDSLKRELEGILISYWDGSDLEFVEGAIAITARLGLVGFFNFILVQDFKVLSLEVAEEIRGAIAEFGHSVGDPYSGVQ
ncbi:hypothetical protein [Pseudomonas sp. H3(2019)]|uniref:hypothetical protein n=1 Tax=Pseudomonas sp. H3(2019) TaxID=2598724 RepID=UPI00119421BA|nr:hypothetical protein [Pseudomonas sp. H3(2019)]TVT79915.1 hypothetical protein FPT12_24490 [Pseudomonas sp. H3(2019)]